MTQFKIPVIEYASAKGGKKLPPSPLFIVNDRQLIISMVRSTLTLHSGKSSRKYMAAIVRPTMQFLLDWNRAPDLRVSSHFLNVLRDFSATTRIGELAQGVNHAYWTWQRGYSWIADFRPWATGLVPVYTSKKSPDFVMFNPVTNDLAILESKGTGSHCHKVTMGKALRQCKDAIAHPAFSRGFGGVLTLDSLNSTGVGTLHIRDPESSGELTGELRYNLFRRSYASWFELVGRQDEANKLRQPLHFEGDEASKAEMDDRENGDTNNPLQEITTIAIGFDPTRTIFGIDPEIEAALANFQVFKEINWQQFAARIRAIPNLEQNQIHFPDGTSIVERTE